MNSVPMDVEPTLHPAADILPFARSYQVEALEMAIKQNTVVYLETGSGKTMIAIMLLRSYAYLLRKPSTFYAVFLVPRVVLVTQQAKALKTNTDLQVGMYWGEMGVDFWDASTWKQEVDKHEVLVMTPDILLRALRHSFLTLEMIKVLIFDECHHARRNHSYACIMREFYHKELKAGTSNIPRILGMTASLVNTKGENPGAYWKIIREHETLMNSKVYTCVNESVLARFIPFSTPKIKVYQPVEVPSSIYASLEQELKNLKAKHRLSVVALDLNPSSIESIEQKMSKIRSSLIYCVGELGIWLALKAAQFLSCTNNDFFPWDQLNIFSETFIEKFCLDASRAISAYIPRGLDWSVANDMRGNMRAGLLTTKTVCLIDSLLEYRALEDIRCIVFVERVITAIVLKSLLDEVLPKFNKWKTKYIAGNNCGLQSQTRRIQNEIVDHFRKGLVNVIVATSILEEGLDVQSCNLVIRFDPSATVCSFIQSRGRARMQNSDYLLMVQNGDVSMISRIKTYLSSGDRMRTESLRLASSPCQPLENDPCDKHFYCVASTGAIVTLSSSINLLYFYCSRLPSDGYFKPAPRFNVDNDRGTCTLYLPKSCPIKTLSIQAGNAGMLRKAACLEACKQLHEVGALTDNLVPVMDMEEAVETINYNDEQPCYFPPELIGRCSPKLESTYHFYIIELKPNYQDKLSVHDIVLCTRVQLEDDIRNTGFELELDRGTMSGTLKYVGMFKLTQKEVLLCRRFQITLLRMLLDHSIDKLSEALDGMELKKGQKPDYLLLPANHRSQKDLINWEPIKSVDFVPRCRAGKMHVECCAKNSSSVLHTKDGLVCTCVVQNALAYTPHNGFVYSIGGILNDLNANSLLTLRDGSTQTYRMYYETRHKIQLDYIDEPLLNGRHIFTVHNYFDRSRIRKEKESGKEFVELPSELCRIILSPISINVVYSFTFIPSIMHRLESLLVAYNLKKMHLECSMQDVVPTIKVLEAITTKKCREQFHLESLETLGDSFLKYAVSQHLFKECQNLHEGLLCKKRERVISNVMLCHLGCERKLQGFIRNECFEPKMWMVPGQNPETYSLTEDSLSDSRRIYINKRRHVKRKSVADVVEALIGAYLSEGGEPAALKFMDWVGIKVDFFNRPYERESVAHAERFVNIGYMESLLNYKFKDRSLLVEALTHGSYMLPEVPMCYQRLEFLGDSVLDYLITRFLYKTYPGITPGLLTDLRSASVNNDCYACAAVKAKLHKHILHYSHDLHKHISRFVDEFEQSSFHPTFGWESETSFPKVLGDVIESLAGAILVDSGYNKEAVFASLQPLLGQMVTPETVRIHPVRELTELCQRKQFPKNVVKDHRDGVACSTVSVVANGRLFEHTAKAADKKMAKKLAFKGVLESLKAYLPTT